jgi:hypothetical protein
LSAVLPGIAVLLLFSLARPPGGSIRYLLPAFPYLYLCAAAVYATLRAYRTTRAAVVVALIASGTETLAAYPYYMCFSNQAAGGPFHTWRWFGDANLDWGQDLLRLKRWLAEHPDFAPVRIAYHGTMPLAVLELAAELPPPDPRFMPVGADCGPGQLAPQPGCYAVSVSLMLGCPGITVTGNGLPVPIRPGQFAYFQELEPVAKPAPSIWCYRIDQTQAAELRERLLGERWGVKVLDR